MRNTVLIIALALAPAGVAAAQQTPAPARPDSVVRADSVARADSIALVRELEGAAGEAADTLPQQGGGPTNPRLLPDISAVADLAADLSPEGGTQEGGQRFGVREVEVAIQAVVDPYFRGDIFLGLSDEEGAAIEQAYLTTTSLPHGLEARLGRFLMPVGKQNTTHRHDLHTLEYPWVIQRFFGPEGLKGTGIQASKVFAPLGFYQEVQATVVDRLGEAEGLAADAPANRRLGGLGYSARLRSYFDLSESSNLEISGTALTGRREQPLEVAGDAGVNAALARQTTLGADVTYRWRPLQQGLYRSLVLQAEVMRQLNEEVDEPGYLGPDRDYTGGYAFGRYQVGRRSFVGARYDRVQGSGREGLEPALSAASGYLEFYPSEFSKLMAGFERLMPDDRDGVSRFLLQAVFSLGPHKPHPF